jgi:N utilization substance protein B
MTVTPALKPRQRSTRTNLAAARLAAVQALYDAEITGADAAALVRDFIEHGLGNKTLLSDEDGVETEIVLADPDVRLFTLVVEGALERRAALDTLIVDALTGAWTVERLEAVLQAVLRAAAFELVACPDVPSKVVISEYVAVAGAFYAGPEPGMVNALLDRIGRQVRGDKFVDDASAR